MPPFLVAVHAGAGFHGPQKEAAYKEEMTRACRAAAAALDAGAGALAAAEAAVASLEDGELANAGRGSNLTAAGRVECDAAVMDGDGAVGAVGAAPGVRNPVAAAAALARDSRVPLSHGRVRPMLLCGDGARVWARARGLEAAATPAAAEAVHVTERAQRQWRKYTDMVGGTGPAAAAAAAPDGAAARRGKRRKRSSGKEEEADEDGAACALYDTVGAVVVDARGRVAAAVSSGGIALKAPGRVGEAAAFGAGCWAADAAGARPAAAASVSGVGERIMRHFIAREACARAASAASPAAACAALLRETVLAGPPPRECGLLCATAAPAGGGRLRVELAAAHGASRSFALACMARGDGAGGAAPAAQALVLRRAAGAAADDVQTFEFGAGWALPAA